MNFSTVAPCSRSVRSARSNHVDCTWRSDSGSSRSPSSVDPTQSQKSTVTVLRASTGRVYGAREARIQGRPVPCVRCSTLSPTVSRTPSATWDGARGSTRRRSRARRARSASRCSRPTSTSRWSSSSCRPYGNALSGRRC